MGKKELEHTCKVPCTELLLQLGKTEVESGWRAVARLTWAGLTSSLLAADAATAAVCCLMQNKVLCNNGNCSELNKVTSGCRPMLPPAIILVYTVL